MEGYWFTSGSNKDFALPIKVAEHEFRYNNLGFPRNPEENLLRTPKLALSDQIVRTRQPSAGRRTAIRSRGRGSRHDYADAWLRLQVTLVL